MPETTREAAVHAALDEVLDPCSCHTENPMSVVELGLIDDVEISDQGDVTVEMLVTSPSCTYFPKMAEEIVERVGAIDGIGSVDVYKERESVWTPARMDEQTQEQRRQRFEEKMTEAGITPVYE